MKRMYQKLLFVCVFLPVCPLPSGGQEGVIPRLRERVEVTVPKGKFHLYLLIGQSNMAGRGIVEPQDTVGNPRILRLNRQGVWEIAKEPLHFDKPEAGVGPGLAFAREMLCDAGDNTVIGLIPCAAGGSSIIRWESGQYWSQTKSWPYDDALVRTRLAMKDGTLKGILWHQGGADAQPDRAAAYKERFIRLVAALRREFDSPAVPFIAGELTGFRTRVDDINRAFREAEKIIPHYGVVSGKGFTPLPDSTHFDSPSQRELGRRYAEKMKELQKIAKR